MRISWAEWYAYSSFSLAGKQARQTLFRLLSSKQVKNYEERGYFDEECGLGKLRLYHGITWNMEVDSIPWTTNLVNSLGATIPIEDTLTTLLLIARGNPSYLNQGAEKSSEEAVKTVTFNILVRQPRVNYIMGKFNKRGGYLDLSWYRD